MKVKIGELETEIENTTKTVIEVDFDGNFLLQITKQESGQWAVTNGINGYGNNVFDEFKDEKVIVD